jgi:SAM-dependent methyltransferase
VHQQVMDWLNRIVPLLPNKDLVCELGSRDVNGSARVLFPGSRYLGVDILPGPGVDVIADAAEFRLAAIFDTVVACEVLEHTPRGREICRTAWHLLRPGGALLVTAATDQRGAHSAIDGGPLHAGEHYANVSEADLRGWLSDFPVVLVQVRDYIDIYALALKGE